jgi:hypothetical protein
MAQGFNRAEFSTEVRRARLARLRPDDGLAFGLSLAESRRLLAYSGFSLHLAIRDQRWSGTPGLALAPHPDRDVIERAA